MKMENLKINKERVIEIIKEYVGEIFETNMFLPLNIETEIKNKEKLWKVTGKILVDIPKIKNIDEILEYIKDSEIFKKKIEVRVKLDKAFDIVSFCFYITSYGKICAFYPVIQELPSEKFPAFLQYWSPNWSEIKEKDLKDYCVVAKNFFNKGMDPKYFDFIPFTGWCIDHNSAILIVVIVSYLRLRTISTQYIIKIVNNEVDIKAIETAEDMLEVLKK